METALTILAYVVAGAVALSILGSIVGLVLFLFFGRKIFAFLQNLLKQQ